MMLVDTTEANPVRASLLDRVAEISPTLERTATESERLRTLCPEAVEILHNAGLFGIWVPEEAGGCDADIVTQIDVLIALAHADMSACWTTMIGNSITAIMAGRLPDKGFAEVFTGDRLPVGVASLQPSGNARRVEGGFVASGRWGFGSGIRHASHVVAYCSVEANQPQPPVMLVVPIDVVDVKDDWNVMGLCGSGSHSYQVHEVFVPEHRVIGERRRGRPDRVEGDSRLPIEHAAVSLGGARRAIDEIAQQAQEKRRMLDPNTVATQQHFRTELGRLEAEWISLNAGLRESARRLEVAWAADLPTVSREAAALKAVCAHVVERALAIGGRTLRYAGAGAILESNVIQRIYRDLSVSAQHAMTSDVAYEAFGTLQVTPND